MFYRRYLQLNNTTMPFKSCSKYEKKDCEICGCQHAKHTGPDQELMEMRSSIGNTANQNMSCNIVNTKSCVLFYIIICIVLVRQI